MKVQDSQSLEADYAADVVADLPVGRRVRTGVLPTLWFAAKMTVFYLAMSVGVALLGLVLFIPMLMAGVVALAVAGLMQVGVVKPRAAREKEQLEPQGHWSDEGTWVGGSRGRP